MEFFKSKYYAPLIQLDNSSEDISVMPCQRKAHADLKLRVQAIRDMALASGGGNNVNKILELFTERFPHNSGYQLLRDKVMDEWTLVEDLCASVYSIYGDYDLDDSNFSDITVYFHPKIECFVRIHPRGQRRKGFDDNLIPLMELRIPYFVNSRNVLRILLAEGHAVREEITPMPHIGVMTRTTKGYDISYTDIDGVSIDLDKMYHGDFKQVSDVIVDSVQKDRSSGLILLHGPAGTGKTNYIRWLSGQTKRRMVYVPPDMVTALTKPDFINFLLRNKGLTFIVEDAEATLSPRQGSELSIVSSILNMTDGLLGDVLETQFICTFNTELTNIDPALLRPGRLLVNHYFDKLDVDEANDYLSSVGIHERVSEASTLGEIMNIGDNAPVTVNKKDGPTFGFGR